MNDTTPGAQRKFKDLMLAKAPAERLEMGCAMFDDAKLLALAGLLAQNPGMAPLQIKRLLVSRLYGTDFPPDKLRRIADSV